MHAMLLESRLGQDQQLLCGRGRQAPAPQPPDQLFLLKHMAFALGDVRVGKIDVCLTIGHAPS